jgi:hypothetical protein
MCTFPPDRVQPDATARSIPPNLSVGDGKAIRKRLIARQKGPVQSGQ